MGNEQRDDDAERRTLADGYSSARIGAAAALTIVLVVLLILDVVVQGYDVSPGPLGAILGGLIASLVQDLLEDLPDNTDGLPGPRSAWSGPTSAPGQGPSRPLVRRSGRSAVGGHSRPRAAGAAA